jgi:hypothetical protein
MRYRGPGRSPWPIILLIVLILVILAVAYWYLFMSPPDIRP